MQTIFSGGGGVQRFGAIESRASPTFYRSTLSNLLVNFRLVELGCWPHDWMPRFSLGLKNVNNALWYKTQSTHFDCLPSRHKQLRGEKLQKTSRNYHGKAGTVLVKLPRGILRFSSPGNFGFLLPSSTTLWTAGFLSGLASSTSSNLQQRKKTRENREEISFGVEPLLILNWEKHKDFCSCLFSWNKWHCPIVKNSLSCDRIKVVNTESRKWKF